MFKLKPVAIGVMFALCALLAGELHGLAFGAKEDAIKDIYKSTAEQNSATLGSPEKVQKAQDKAWHYLKRAHMHYMGLGAVSMVLIIFTGLSPASTFLKTVVSSAVGFGALVYPLFWTIVSFKTAAIGAHGAKEALALLAQAGAGVGFLGLLGTIGIAVIWIKSDESI